VLTGNVFFLETTEVAVDVKEGVSSCATAKGGFSVKASEGSPCYFDPSTLAPNPNPNPNPSYNPNPSPSPNPSPNPTPGPTLGPTLGPTPTLSPTLAWIPTQP